MTSDPNASLRSITSRILEASKSGPALAACTVINVSDDAGVVPGAKLLVQGDGSTHGTLGEHASPELRTAVERAALEAIPEHTVATYTFTPSGDLLRGRRTIEAAPATVEILIEVIEPAATLLVVGGGHVGRAVAELGAFVGMSVAVLDDREEYANQERFPFVDRVIHGDFAEELRRFPFTTNTFVVLVSRGHLVDELSLREVITHDIAYLGMIGSKRRTRTVLEHMEAEGVPRERLDRVFTPIGLDLEAETPEEIAVSVVGEIVLVRRGGVGAPLSEAGAELVRGRLGRSGTIEATA